jgi:hypothetical protein
VVAEKSIQVQGETEKARLALAIHARQPQLQGTHWSMEEIPEERFKRELKERQQEALLDANWP